MKAAVLTKLNFPLEISEVELTELSFGQVLVKNICSGLCGSQLQEISGAKGNEKFLPHLMGHEGFGEVVEVGIGVTKVKIGDKVVLHWMKGSGIESPFPQYKYNGKLISSGKVTTFSEYSIVSENRVTKASNDSDPEFGALLGCAITTAIGTVYNEAKIKPGETVMIIGGGGVGAAMCKAAQICGASQIYVSDISRSKVKMDLIRSCGGILITQECAVNADVIIDTVGSNSVTEYYLKFLKNSGRYIVVGQNSPQGGFNIINSNHMFGSSGKCIIWTQGGKTNPDIDIPLYLDLNKAVKIKASDLVTHKFSLDQINEAFTILRSGQCGRILIKF